MFYNYIKLALRHFSKNKLHSLINIGGLTVGMTACILIMLFVRDELHYDQWIKDAELIHKLEVTFKIAGQAPVAVAVTQMPAAPNLLLDYPEISAAVRIVVDRVTVRSGDTPFSEHIYYADNDFFTLFDIPLISGVRMISENNSILLSKSMAKKYFGNTDPIGKILTVDGHQDYQVVGVLEDTPKNTHFQLNLIARLDTNRAEFQRFNEAWDRIRVHTYIKLKPGVNPESLAKDFPQFIQRHNALRDMPNDGLEFNLIPLNKIHLYGKKPGHLGVNGDITAIWIFSGIGLLILLIGSINFMTLSTARAIQRAREVSLRKVHGATRLQLIAQFLGESLVTSLAALIVALMLSLLCLSNYNSFLNKNLSLNIFNDPLLGALIFFVAIVVGLLGGCYPAFVLSSFRPAQVLRSNKSAPYGSVFVRSMLVVMQFSISIGLTLATMFVFVQTDYMRNKDLGYSFNNKLNLYDLDADKIDVLKNALLNLHDVKMVAMAKKALPFDRGGTYEAVNVLGRDSGSSFNTEIVEVGSSFFQVYEVKPLAGRLFSDKFESDMHHSVEGDGYGTAGVVVNESFAKKIGFGRPAELIGSVLRVEAWKLNATVVGVIPNIYVRSLHEDIGPMIFIPKNDNVLDVMTVDLASNNTVQSIAEIEKIWNRLIPATPINHQLVKERFMALYSAEDTRTKLLGVFAFLAIFVASLGLYGLASYDTERRTKEIGIRKIMGARKLDIIRLILWEFSRLILISCVIGAIPALWFVNDWLQTFSFRINLLQNSYLILLVVIFAILIAWLTVIGQVWKVAQRRPTDVLRHE